MEANQLLTKFLKLHEDIFSVPKEGKGSMSLTFSLLQRSSTGMRWKYHTEYQPTIPKGYIMHPPVVKYNVGAIITVIGEEVRNNWR